MRKESCLMERSQAEALKARLLYQDVCLAAQRLDLLLRKGNAHKEVFKTHVLALRDVVQQVCLKLMFFHPVDYGRKAEELLWRKNEHCDLRLLSYTDGPHSAIHLIGCKKAGPASEEEVAWVRMACHRYRLYLGDLFRFQNEFPALATKDLVERASRWLLLGAEGLHQPVLQQSPDHSKEIADPLCRGPAAHRQGDPRLAPHQPQPPRLTLAESTSPVGSPVCAAEPAALRGALQEPGLGLSHQLRDLLQSCKGPSLPRCLQLPEDIALGQHSPRQASQERAGLEQDPPLLSSQDEAAVRICFLRSFGHLATTLPGQFPRFISNLGVFVSSGFEGPDNLSQQFLERTSRIRFSKDIVQLWLQSEVVQLEKILRNLQIQSALTPYLFPDPRALCEHLPVIEQLATSGKFLLIIPKIVVDILYVLRKEDCWALAAITFLEDELKGGNQYIFCQSFVSTRLVRPRMTRPDSDAWDLYNILDFCKGLLDSSQPGTPDPSSMITIITGICLDNPGNFSYALQLVMGTAIEAGVEIKNIRRFHREWKTVS
ncbi:hypothetical protein J1605_007628 [Eschrichtius robustus]|uniref:Nonsense-mediated mRNA decay factor SMG5 n=1 Tax=Eschrichtius robustus TaxID=9764 RepID=A0AB34GX61_ESCRO|nr:hypothetical protein J1605_007628 [Eschrichtius robustus]